MKNGTVKGDDYGNLSFTFDDGTEAVADWKPTGELEDGKGGGFYKRTVDPLNSGLTRAQIVELAYANYGVYNPAPITQPEPKPAPEPVRSPPKPLTSHQLAQQLLTLPDLPLQTRVSCFHNTVGSDENSQISVEHDERRSRIVIGGHTTGEFEWVDDEDDEDWEEDDRVFEEDLAPEDA